MDFYYYASQTSPNLHELFEQAKQLFPKHFAFLGDLKLSTDPEKAWSELVSTCVYHVLTWQKFSKSSEPMQFYWESKEEGSDGMFFDYVQDLEDDSLNMSRYPDSGMFRLVLTSFEEPLEASDEMLAKLGWEVSSV